MSLSRLIYVSTARDDLTRADLDAILETARSRNAEEDVTGFLLFNGHNFMQALEGSAEAVEAIFESICQDSRHHGVVRILVEDHVDREFADWSMGFGEFDVRAGRAFEVSHAELDALLPTSMSGELRLLFTSFNTMPQIQTPLDTTA